MIFGRPFADTLRLSLVNMSDLCGELYQSFLLWRKNSRTSWE